MHMVFKNNVPFFISKNLKNFNHGFFTRIGGKSEGIYNSLNCGYSSSDSKKNIKKNRSIISNILNFNLKNLIVADQYHSNIVKIYKQNTRRFKCDALINFDANIALGVLTADCCPILVGHKKETITGAIHVGWKGLYSGILENFVSKILSNKIKTEDLIFAIGPCINKNSFQVSEEFFCEFVKKDKDCNLFFVYKSKENSFYFDLKGYIKKKLNLLGAFNIDFSSEDTYKNSNRYFSYRYSCHNGFNNYGRMLAVIVKK